MNVVDGEVDTGQVWAAALPTVAVALAAAIALWLLGSSPVAAQGNAPAGTASISGTIRTVEGVTLSGAWVEVYGRGRVGGWFPYGRVDAEVGAVSASFTVDGLAAGDYLVCVHAYDDGHRSIGECYDNVSLDLMMPISNVPGFSIFELLLQAFTMPPDYTVVGVGAGEERRGINFVVGDLELITGKVTNQSGEPLAGIQVSLFAQPDFMAPVAPASGGSPSAVTVTAADGTYHAGYLAPGSYTVRFLDPQRDYLVAYYAGAERREDAESLPITARSSYSGIDMVMTRAGVITGTFQGAQWIAHNSLLPLLFRAEAGAWVPVGFAEYGATGERDALIAFDGSGAYRIGGLVPGRYRVGFNYSAPDGARQGFFGGATLEGAADIVVAAGTTSAGYDIDFVQISGTVGVIAGTVTAEDIPQPGIRVVLFINEVPWVGPDYPQAETVTDDMGRYRFEGLGNLGYQVAAIDPAGRYATAFYDNASHLLAASSVMNDGLTVREDLDFALLPSATLQGRVHFDEARPAAKYQVMLYVLTHGNWYTAGYPLALSQADGSYTFTALGPGVYRLGAVPGPGSSPCPPDLICAPGGSFFGGDTVEYAQDIEVRAGETLTGIGVAVAAPELPATPDQPASPLIPMPAAPDQPASPLVPNIQVK